MLECKACGYKYEVEYVYNKDQELCKKILHGDEKFIEIEGNFTYRENIYDHRIYQTSLFMCPKCHNVIAEL